LRGETMNMPNKNIDLNIQSFQPLITPLEARAHVVVSDESILCVTQSRDVVRNILDRKDPRKFVVVGPCSIHDPKAAMEYAHLLSELARELGERLFIIMRTYFEKPRTTIGWKGFINDPHLNNTFDMNEGLIKGRQLLCDITALGLPVANEALDPIVPQYLADLITWTAIGARTTESQLHREMASGLSAPVGFKNTTDGNVLVAINAMKSARSRHHFLGIDEEGRTAIVATKGNPHCHLILRGGSDGPNYDAKSVKTAEEALASHSLPRNIVIDCSHDNSKKDFRRQPSVLEDCIKQIKDGDDSIVGFMLESHLHEGNQPLSDNLRYGVSITDGCLSFDDTKRILKETSKQL